MLCPSYIYISGSDRLWASVVLKLPLNFVPLSSIPSNMTEASNSNESNSSTCDGLPKLKDNGGINNYGEWKTKAELQLLSWDLLKYVTGPESSPQSSLICTPLSFNEAVIPPILLALSSYFVFMETRLNVIRLLMTPDLG